MSLGVFCGGKVAPGEVCGGKVAIGVVLCC